MHVIRAHRLVAVKLRQEVPNSWALHLQWEELCSPSPHLEVWGLERCQSLTTTEDRGKEVHSGIEQGNNLILIVFKKGGRIQLSTQVEKFCQEGYTTATRNLKGQKNCPAQKNSNINVIRDIRLMFTISLC